MLTPDELRKGMRFSDPDSRVSVRNRNYRWMDQELVIRNMRRNYEDPAETVIYYEDSGGNKYKTTAQDFIDRYGEFYKESRLAFANSVLNKLAQVPTEFAVENLNPASVPRACPNCGTMAMGPDASEVVGGEGLKKEHDYTCSKCGMTFSLNTVPGEEEIAMFGKLAQERERYPEDYNIELPEYAGDSSRGELLFMLQGYHSSQWDPIYAIHSRGSGEDLSVGELEALESLLEDIDKGKYMPGYPSGQLAPGDIPMGLKEEEIYRQEQDDALSDMSIAGDWLPVVRELLGDVSEERRYTSSTEDDNKGEESPKRKRKRDLSCLKKEKDKKTAQEILYDLNRRYEQEIKKQKEKDPKKKIFVIDRTKEEETKKEGQASDKIMPEVHDSMEDLRELSESWVNRFSYYPKGLTEEDIAQGWVITPFQFAKGTSKIDELNWHSVQDIISEEFPENIQVDNNWGQTLAVRAFEPDGTLTPAGKLLESLMGSISDYPLLDDESHSDAEYEAHLEAISQGAPFTMREDIPEDWEKQVFGWLWDNKQESVEIEDSGYDFGGLSSLISGGDVLEAAEALGFLESDEEEEDLEPWKLNPDQIDIFKEK